MNKKKGVERISELFEFLMRNIVDECVKTKIETTWVKTVPLKDAPTHLNERSLAAVSYNRSVKIRIKGADKVLYFIRNVMS